MKEKGSDKDLVLAFQSGDKNALNKLVKKWHKTFCEKAYWLVKDADVAKDIAQDSWSVIIRKIDALKNPERFGSWALRIVCNNAIDWLNINKRQQKHKEQIKYEQEVISSQSLKEDVSNIKQKLLESYKKLPKHQQVIIKLFYTENYSLKEICLILNISVGTAKSRLFHGREKLKQLLKHDNYEN